MANVRDHGNCISLRQEGIVQSSEGSNACLYILHAIVWCVLVLLTQRKASQERD